MEESLLLGLLAGYAIASIKPQVQPITETRKKICSILHDHFTDEKFKVHHHVHCLVYGPESALEKYSMK